MSITIHNKMDGSHDYTEIELFFDSNHLQRATEVLQNIEFTVPDEQEKSIPYIFSLIITLLVL